MFAVFFFVINVHSKTRYSKNGIPDQTDGICTLFQNKMAKSIPYFRLEMLENGTLWGSTYLYGLYMGVSPPPPPGAKPPFCVLKRMKMTPSSRLEAILEMASNKHAAGPEWEQRSFAG